jgi:nicotinamidase-related amidase
MSALSFEHALIVVDVQQGFDAPSWGRRSNSRCEENIAALITAWRQQGWPVVYVRHDSVLPASALSPRGGGNALKPALAGEPDLLIVKHTNSAFYGTPDLHAFLQDRHLRGVAVCGFTTNHCCESTARMAGNLGYSTKFILDATCTFDRRAPDGEWIPAEELMRVTATNLNEEFAVVLLTHDVLDALAPERREVTSQ